MSIKFQANTNFDFNKKRFYLNDNIIVLNCHHYTTLLTQLANDATRFNGPKIMFSVAEKTFYRIFNKYFKEHNITSLEDRVIIVEQYYSYIGLGLMKIDFKNKNVELLHSHLDEAWLKKWSTSDKPVNYITKGFIAGAFSAITESDLNSFVVNEIQSIACGAKTSEFIIDSNRGE